LGEIVEGSTVMSGKRILVVDDDPTVGLAIKLQLEAAGDAVEVVTSAFEALRKFDIGKYDVIVTDFRMPGMTGLQLAEQIKSRSAVQPIILFTASLLIPPSTAVDRVLFKPSSTLELTEAVGQLSKRERGIQPEVQ
jgi:CheY-like chemotaxis protein